MHVSRRCRQSGKCQATASDQQRAGAEIRAPLDQSEFRWCFHRLANSNEVVPERTWRDQCARRSFIEKALSAAIRHRTLTHILYSKFQV